jgi:hypothetical protein
VTLKRGLVVLLVVALLVGYRQYRLAQAPDPAAR